MAKEKPDLISQTQENKFTTTDSKIATKRKVSYEFTIGSKKSLSLPYAIAVNGKALPAYDKKPARVGGDKGLISVMVNQADKVSLYLNSDAHPSYRKEPVYEVTAGERNIKVIITEKYGKHSDSDKPTQTKEKDDAAEAKKNEDTYTAPLTGDIWLKVSHPYTPSEAEALIPVGTRPEVTAAVKTIYDILKIRSLTITLPAGKENPANTIAVTFADADNPNDNITKFDLLNQGLPRVHPAGYVALFNAAIDAGVAKMTMSSAWRPMVGSIAHRAGLGLDVNYVGGTRMNRQILRDDKAVDAKNVSKEERKLFKEFLAAKEELAKAKHAAEAALENVGKVKKDPIKLSLAEAERKKADDVLKAATDQQEKTKKDWEKELEKNQPASVKLFRGSLMDCACVNQLFDPWYMDNDTHDKIAPIPNTQTKDGKNESNETLHAHHLHITVEEKKIL
ncbi:MAG: hypothetical protein Q7R66_12175 [Undibacterium sp.]|uniref:hypothetical protein n=1 Tax=Undibacterium sp. TaxID=1914977 RepID=UPI0027156464|nr:hypothetical protein [Undibacterium sp.]MDO8652936.1 hypothetical protein [Undibacterium sp.]